MDVREIASVYFRQAPNGTAETFNKLADGEKISKEEVLKAVNMELEDCNMLPYKSQLEAIKNWAESDASS